MAKSIALILLAGALAMPAGEQPRMARVSEWQVFESKFDSRQEYANPLWDVLFQVTFTAPSGAMYGAEAFWDGGRTWRVRFSPDQVGRWKYAGPEGLAGEFECARYRGINPIYRHGPVRVSRNRRHFVHADGEPFFFMSDTAWNGVLRSRLEDWERYLDIRRVQGFTATQFVTTHWRALPKDANGETAFTGKERIQINPKWFQRLDSKIAAINKHGLIAMPVLLWALGDSPGRNLPEEDAIRLARYMVARWGAHQVMWMLGGDGNYRGDNAERWKRIGRAVFGGSVVRLSGGLERNNPTTKPANHRLVTMHPQGLHWVMEEFRSEPWFGFVGYQSGHGDSLDHVRWLVNGPPAQDWRKEPPIPIINLEPNYEGHISYHSKKVFDAHKVRRALYWSLLVSPTAGVTYGHHGIWNWGERPELPVDHPNTGIAPPWHEAVHAEGAECVKHLRTFFNAVQWSRLRPAPDLLAEQPGTANPDLFVAATQTEDGKTTVFYLPEGGSVALRPEVLKSGATMKWFDPRAGKWTHEQRIAAQRLSAPGPGDWAILIQSEK